MPLKILCSGHLIRYPVGGFSWHHLQYLVGVRRLGHEVVYFEDHGWPASCYDPSQDVMTADPAFGLAYFQDLLRLCRVDLEWCYFAEDGREHGMSRKELAPHCRNADLFLNLSNINWIPELEQCRRRVLIDTDPVFTQIGAHGMGGPFSRYDVLFTYGENIHRPGCTCPTGGVQWLPTRQPVVLDLWPVRPGNPAAPFTTVMNWSAYGEHQHEGRCFGQKDREFESYLAIPRLTGEPMQIALNGPRRVRDRLAEHGWQIVNPRDVTYSPQDYQGFIGESRAEFSVAKHGYVSTRSGWFSDRSCAYLAMGRPVVLQDTGFSDVLPCGEGLLPFTNIEEAGAAIQEVSGNYARHCRAARAVAERCFDAKRVLTDLLDRSFSDRPAVAI